MIAAVDAERIKLTSTRSPYWCIGIVVVLAIGVAALVGSTVRGTSVGPTATTSAWTALIGLNQFGVLVLMIMAVLAITSEYRFGTIRTTFQAVPRRPTVLAAKAIVFGGLALVVTGVLAVVALVLVHILGGRSAGIDFADSGVLRQIWGTAVVAALYVLVGLGVGAIVRHTAGAIVVVLIWNLALESILRILPKVGSHIAPFLPFANAGRFLSDTSGEAVSYHWNVYGSLLYFAVFAIAVFAIGIVMVDRRDA